MELKDWSFGSDNPCLIIGNINTHEVELTAYDEGEPSPCRYCELRDKLVSEVAQYGGEHALDYEIKHTLLTDACTCKKEGE